MKNLFVTFLFGVVSVLGTQGCSTIFDAPQGGGDLSEQVPDSVLASLDAMAQKPLSGLPDMDVAKEIQEQGIERATALAGGVLQGRARQALAREKFVRQSAESMSEPTVFFERIATTMPQLIILDGHQAAVWLNGQRLTIPESSASHVFLLNPGEYQLKVLYWGGNTTAFEALLRIAQRERVTVRLTPSNFLSDVPTSTEIKKKR